MHTHAYYIFYELFIKYIRFFRACMCIHGIIQNYNYAAMYVCI